MSGAHYQMQHMCQVYPTVAQFVTCFNCLFCFCNVCFLFPVLFSIILSYPNLLHMSVNYFLIHCSFFILDCHSLTFCICLFLPYSHIVLFETFMLCCISFPILANVTTSSSNQYYEITILYGRLYPTVNFFIFIEIYLRMLSTRVLIRNAFITPSCPTPFRVSNMPHFKLYDRVWFDDFHTYKHTIMSQSLSYFKLCNSFHGFLQNGKCEL